MTLLSNLLRRRRLETGMKLSQIAQELGCHESYLSMLERGLRRPIDELVVRLARALKIDPSLALLAALRERLPEEMRSLVPDSVRPEGTQDALSIARQVQAAHAEYEVGCVTIAVTVDWDGNRRMIRTFRDCRPNADGRPVGKLSFRERVVGVRPEADAPEAKFSILTKPRGLEYEVSSQTVDSWREHRVSFPKGWRRASQKSGDTFSFSLEAYQEKAYVIDTASFVARSAAEGNRPLPQGSINYHLKHFAHRLEVSLDFPRGYEAERWDSQAWFGSEVFDGFTRNLAGKGVSRSFELRSQGDHARLVADDPLAGYTFALVWTPADPKRYLESRYGGRDDQHPQQVPDSLDHPAPGT